jgi:CubicO group peptidase (beta-lactamase class C family)
MKSVSLSVAGALLLATVAHGTFAQTPARMPEDGQIRKVLADRIDVQQQGIGIVVGVIDSQGKRIVSYGSAAVGSRQPLNGQSVFEIGSATKVFTALLLADAVQRGEVALADPISRYLPAEVKVPARGGRQITLEDLATHTSGLPRLPSNLSPADPTNPYADYTVPQLYAFLSSYELPRDIGARYEYSNLGAGLLGHILARRAGVDYETLVRTRITQPLGMTSTAIGLTAEMKPRLVAGHNAGRVAVPLWDLPTLAGAGALRSSADDLLIFLSAQLGLQKTALSAAATSTLATRRPTGQAGLEIALGWHLLETPGGGEIAWHNGGTGGYRSFIGFNRTNRTAVVVLSNMSTAAGADDIGRHLLDAGFPLMQATAARKAITVTGELLEGYVGRFELAPTFIITITREGTRLFLQATNQPRFELFAETERKFFLKEVNAQVTFEVDKKGRAVRLILHQGGANQPAKRIE